MEVSGELHENPA